MSVGFVLLEVLISVVILGISVATILRSFTQSMEAARRSDFINTATLLAQDLLEEIQVSPPAVGLHEGDFGESHSGYTFSLRIADEPMEYKQVDRAREIKDLRFLRTAHLEVFHVDPRRGPVRMISLDSAVMGLQKFSDAALREYQLFELY